MKISHWAFSQLVPRQEFANNFAVSHLMPEDFPKSYYCESADFALCIAVGQLYLGFRKAVLGITCVISRFAARTLRLSEKSLFVTESTFFIAGEIW